MITVTIDGKTVQTEPTKTIIDAAFENGIYIPHFCWHPSLSISGNCRMCLVDVEKMPKQVIACSTLCMDGMVVHVNSEKAIAARNAVMEFILINHPLDCPICDEAGECKLQEYAYRYSVGESRFDEDKVHKRKRDPLGPNVMFDAERCISCSRCIRFCEDLVGSPQLTFVNRGDRVTIETAPGKELDNPYSMNVIDLCPVGALTSVEYRFAARAWDLSSTPEVCTGCARGCNSNAWVRQNRILRMTPRENQEVNRFWMCDNGRLNSWKHVHDASRITTPMIRRNGALEEAGWDDAIAAAARGFRDAKKGVAVIASAFDTCEDNFSLARLAADVFRNAPIDIVPHVRPGDEDAFLIRADKTPNAAGSRLAGAAPGDGSSVLDDILAKARSGALGAVLVTDRLAHEHPGLLDALIPGVFVVAAVTNASPLTDRADVVLAAAASPEKGGTYLNFDGQLQLSRAAIVTVEGERWSGGFAQSRLDRFASEFDRWGTIPRANARPTWKIARDLARAMGMKWKYEDAEDVFGDLAAKVPGLRNLTWETIGRWGVRIGGETRPRPLPYIYSDVHP